MIVGPTRLRPMLPGRTGARAAAPVLLRPRDADPTGGVHRLLPRAAALERLPIGRYPVVGWIVETEVGREVRREPVAKLPVESVLDGGVLEVHRARAETSRLALPVSRRSMATANERERLC